MPFWALSVLYAWKGFENNKTLDWLLFGLFAALGILSKYLFIYLLAAMDIFFCYMIIRKKANFKSLISLIPFFLILFPHLIWLTENDYITITYGLQRTGTGDQNFLDHFLHPLIFLAKQFGILIPLFVMFLAPIFLILPRNPGTLSGFWGFSSKNEKLSNNTFYNPSYHEELLIIFLKCHFKISPS